MVSIEVEDPDKHERVAKALEQINSLRYRYKGAARKPEKKDINGESDDDDDDGEDQEDCEAKSTYSRAASAGQSRKGDAHSERLLTLDEQIERMLLRTRTVALLKIANNTADVLPDDDDDEEDDDYLEEAEYEDDDDEGGSFTTRYDDDDEYSDERSDVFTHQDVSLVGGSHSSSMQRLGSMRRPTSFRTASFRSSGSADTEATAALRLARKLSTFLNLPKVISYKDLEEITESLLDEPHDESDEYAHLIDEHVDSARDSMGGDSSAVASDLHNMSTRSMGLRHMATQKSLRDLNISDDPEDLELQQRRLFVENVGLRRYSSKKLLSASSRTLLRASSKQLVHNSPSASSHDLMLHKESKRSLHLGESWRSGAGPGSITSLQEESDDKDDDDASRDEMQADGVLGTTFDEHGYKQWRTEIKDDYLAWIRAKLEAKRLRKLQKQKDADKKPRWQLLYEAASKGRPTSAAEEETKATEPRKASNAKRPARQSVG